MKKQTPFKIERVDSLGQGVSFDNDHNKVNFITKTLPGEEGTAQILGAKGKKVQFAEAIEVSKTSPDRIPPECPHYKECPACSFLHTHYEKESELKKMSYSFLYRNHFDTQAIVYTQAPRRFAYRNRIQLHYNKKKELLGLMASDQILQIPHCLIPLKPLQEKLKELYENKAWKKVIEGQPDQGHIELYLKNESTSEVSIAINQRYAHDGFTQVFAEMNGKVLNSIQSYYKSTVTINPEKEIVLDLFGGDGNLSQKLNLPTLVVDYYTEPKATLDHQEFLSLNLYSAEAIKTLMKKISSHQVGWLILDPPRSGLKNLDQFVERINPQKISYLSCNPNTQVRDIKPLLEKGWVIESIEFLDLFPSTHHLESFVHLKKA